MLSSSRNDICKQNAGIFGKRSKYKYLVRKIKISVINCYILTFAENNANIATYAIATRKKT